MKRLSQLCFTLFASVALTFCSLSSCIAGAASPSGHVIRFHLCSDNVKSIGLYKQSGDGNLWHFVITLNDAGTVQFRTVQHSHFGEPVAIVWAGVQFGRRRLDIADLSDTRNLLLVSRWQRYREAQARIALLKRRLLHKQNLHSPCGFTERGATRKRA